MDWKNETLKKKLKNNQTNKRMFGHFKLSIQQTYWDSPAITVSWFQDASRLARKPADVADFREPHFFKVPQWKIAETGKK